MNSKMFTNSTSSNSHLLLLAGIIFVGGVSLSFGRSISIRNSEKLDPDGNLVLGWEVDEEKGIITFSIDAATTGFIGLGISPSGSMIGADIFVCGVYPNGTVYHEDRQGIGFSKPVLDKHQDWKLIYATEYGNRTFVKVERRLDTCDEEDYPIGVDTTRLIYAYGESDQLTYHGTKRGTKSINFRGPVSPELDMDGVETHKFILNHTMPSEDTSYWCSFFRGPTHNGKHHIVGFDAVLNNSLSIAHTHHMILYNCYPPTEGAEELFGNYTVDAEYKGELCYAPHDPSQGKPYLVGHCQEYLNVWAKGGKKMVFPQHVGYPISSDYETERRGQFYMLEIHYDNPGKLEGLTFDVGIEFFHTDKLREEDAGLLLIAYDVSPALTVPPNMESFVVAGHCGGSCTSQIPPNGITAFNSMLHSHYAGRKLKIRHFRGTEELPWIDFDNHYDFNYQSNKHLKDEVKIRPGDHLTYECTYNSEWTNGRVIIGDLKTTDEMCQSYLWYYPKINLDTCVSWYDMTKGMQEIGITNYTKIETVGHPKVWINEPEYLCGDYEESLSTKYQWTDKFSKELEYKRRFTEQRGICRQRKNEDQDVFYEVNYPQFETPYEPENNCLVQQIVN